MRKRLMIAGALLILMIAAVWGGSVIYANVQNNKASDAFTLKPAPSKSAAPVEGASLSGTWKIAAGSQAGYRVDEVLNGQNATVVGRTDNIEGEATMDGTTLKAASATVSMTSLSTDSGSRDRQFQGILKTGEFPTSTFELTRPVDLAAITSGVATVSAAGELTIAGVSKQVTVNLTAQRTADAVQVQGSIPITFADFGVQAPNLAFVRVEDAGTVEMLLNLKR